MVSIDEIHSEINVGYAGNDASEVEPDEVLLEDLREIVRQLLAEEYERMARISVADSRWPL